MKKPLLMVLLVGALLVFVSAFASDNAVVVTDKNGYAYIEVVTSEPTRLGGRRYKDIDIAKELSVATANWISSKTPAIEIITVVPQVAHVHD